MQSIIIITFASSNKNKWQIGMKKAKRKTDNIIIEDDDMRDEIPMLINKKSKALFYLNSLL